MVIEAIESIVRQDYRPLELIVINDGSTDDSEKIVIDWKDDFNESSDVDIRVVSQVNKGAPAARNLGLALATGEYVQFFDSDDLMAEASLTNRITAMYDFKADVVFGRSVSFKNVSDIKNVRLSSFEKNWELLPTIEYIANYPIFTGSLLYKNSFLKKNNLQFHQELRCGQERFLNLQCALAGAKFHFVDEIVEFHHIGGGDNISSEKWIKRDPFRYLEMEIMFLEEIKKEKGVLVSENLNKIISKRLWWRGRMLVANKRVEEGKIYFKKALVLTNKIPQSKLYSFFYFLLGPSLTESLNKLIKGV